MNHLIKIDVTIDTRIFEQVTAFANLMHVIGGSFKQVLTEDGTVVQVGETEVEKPKATRTKAKKVEGIKIDPTATINDLVPPVNTTDAVAKYVEEKISETVEENNESDVRLVLEQEQAEAEGPIIKIEDIRKLAAEKQYKHRLVLKAKLKEFGVANVTTLPEKNYQEFYDLLNSLD